MKRIIVSLILLFALGQAAFAQQFNLPIMPQKMWPSDYAKYESDVLNCCDYLLATDPAFNHPKHEECTSFLVRWLTGTPEVQVVVSEQLVDANNSLLLVAYMAAWTRYSLRNKDSEGLICANVATTDMLDFYVAHKESIGTSKLAERLLREQANGNLPAIITKALVQ